MTRFDSLEKRVFDTAGRQFGPVAVWHPSTGDPDLEAQVLFNRPSEKDGVSEVKEGYDPTGYYLEYFEGSFPGLKSLVDESKEERITVEGADYWVREVVALWDGKTYRAKLVPKLT